MEDIEIYEFFKYSFELIISFVFVYKKIINKATFHAFLYTVVVSHFDIFLNSYCSAESVFNWVMKKVNCAQLGYGSLCNYNIICLLCIAEAFLQDSILNENIQLEKSSSFARKIKRSYTDITMIEIILPSIIYYF